MVCVYSRYIYCVYKNIYTYILYILHLHSISISTHPRIVKKFPTTYSTIPHYLVIIISRASVPLYRPIFTILTGRTRPFIYMQFESTFSVHVFEACITVVVLAGNTIPSTHLIFTLYTYIRI